MLGLSLTRFGRTIGDRGEYRVRGEEQSGPGRSHPSHGRVQRLDEHPAIRSRREAGSDASRGLTGAEARIRLAHWGPNSLPPPRRRGPWLRLALQFHNPLIYVLLAAAITLGLRDYLDTAVIVGVVIINATIGFLQEGRAKQALEAVRSLLANRATLVRDGERHDIDALVAGVGSLTTPLTRQVDRFARRITALVLVAGAAVFVYGRYVQHMAALDIFLAVVGLAVAAIPEGLPAIVTITLAIGTNAMAR